MLTFENFVKAIQPLHDPVGAVAEILKSQITTTWTM